VKTGARRPNVNHNRRSSSINVKARLVAWHLIEPAKLERMMHSMAWVAARTDQGTEYRSLDASLSSRVLLLKYLFTRWLSLACRKSPLVYLLALMFPDIPSFNQADTAIISDIRGRLSLRCAPPRSFLHCNCQMSRAIRYQGVLSDKSQPPQESLVM
jgi:hypothetical protein